VAEHVEFRPEFHKEDARYPDGTDEEDPEAMEAAEVSAAGEYESIAF
jgi:hypothetical protein